MCVKCLNLLDEVKQWVAMLDGYELDIAMSKNFDSFWYKQKLAELTLLMEMDNDRNTGYLQTEYSEISHQLAIDQIKLELLKPHPPSGCNHRSLCWCSSPTNRLPSS